jgi:hypothetical protein
MGASPLPPIQVDITFGVATHLLLGERRLERRAVTGALIPILTAFLVPTSEPALHHPHMLGYMRLGAA